MRPPLARRFRGSPGATRCVAQPRAMRPHAAQRRNVGPTTFSILCFVRDWVELKPAAPLPAAGCALEVGRMSLCVSCVREGARSRHPKGGTHARHAPASFRLSANRNHFGRVAEPQSACNSEIPPPKYGSCQWYASLVSARVATARAGQLVAAPDARPFADPAAEPPRPARRCASRCRRAKAARRVSS